MGELAGKQQKISILPAKATGRNRIKIKLPKGVWTWMLPLAAAAIIVTFNGCADKRQQAQKEVNDVGNSALMLEMQDASPKNTMKLTPVKTEGKEKRDSLLKARINALGKEALRYAPSLPERGVRTQPKTGNWEIATKELGFITFEQSLYSSALMGETANVKKYKQKINELGKEYGEEERASKIIKNFDDIMLVK